MNKDAKQQENSDNENDNDENKIEKNPLEKSFDLSSDEDDEDLDDDIDMKENENNDANYLDDLMSKSQNEEKSGEKQETDDQLKQNSGVKKSDNEGTVTKTSMPSTSADSKTKADNLRKKNQSTDNSSKELARKKKLEQMEEEFKKMQ